MEFKAKPIFINWNRDFDGKYGKLHVFNMTVETEEGKTIEGYFRTTKKEQTKFILNETVLMKTKDGEENHEKVLIFDKVSLKPNGGVSSKEKDRSIAANVSIHCAAWLLSSNPTIAESVKDDLKGYLAVANKIYEWLEEHRKKGTQEAINSQAQIKIVCEFFHKFPELHLENSTAALKYADMLFDWVNMKMK